MSNMHVKVAATPEIMGAIVADDKAIIMEYAGKIEADVAIVDNTDTQVHLALPYYANLENTSISQISEDDLEAVAGGEVFITIAIIGAAACGVGFVACTTGIGALVDEEENYRRKTGQSNK